MKKTLLLISSAILLFDYSSKAQSTAMDFNITDCNGTSHHLFSDLDAGNVVIIEFFMTSCTSCITAGQKLEPMKADLLAEFPGKIKSYAFGFNNTYTCTQVKNWVTNNSFTSIPSDSGAAQVAYYGGMGMPTIVVLGGGSAHAVLGTPYVGFSTSDTATMANAIRGFLNPSGVKETSQAINSLDVFPNPANDKLNLTFNLDKNSTVKIELVDITGRTISVMSNETLMNGKINKTIETGSFAEGNYILKISTGETVINKKINIVH